MRKLKFILTFILLVTLKSFSQENHIGKLNVEVIKTYSQNVFGKNIGYYVEFKNNSDLEVDGIKWTASFYDNFGELKGKKEGSWQSGNIIAPIKPGEIGKDLENSFIAGATKVYIKITLVHFVKK
jgi:hypothetical protein